ncbi:hypothetical protein GCM10027275_37440 [Rhabdobacter roseus]|uniref:Outer membrane protein beta-barrel domain-containing protein n=1 Tax=Rhabdobacter roseus TaxID=1655419 RepID=A0A840U0E1_9BACT|nr:hypothetical protein [Rhabdobacter roseus]MBB5285848.1 hypothetical protein [Rhabdobacter roseus]
MKKCIVIVSLLLFVGSSLAQAQIQSWAAGFKLGEPTGVNLRKYGDRNALDITVGTYGMLLGNYRDYRSGNYRTMGLMLNGSYLWYAPLFRERMSAYAGVGLQVNSRRYYPNRFDNLHVKNISLGPSGTVGLEYFSPYKSTSFFLEGGAYVEFLPGFFFTSPQLSIGIRTNF